MVYLVYVVVCGCFWGFGICVVGVVFCFVGGWFFGVGGFVFLGVLVVFLVVVVFGIFEDFGGSVGVDGYVVVGL